jgi:hypothetical protein
MLPTYAENYLYVYCEQTFIKLSALKHLLTLLLSMIEGPML